MPETQCRMRVYYHKGNEVKYISHLDTLRAWERAIRRSGLPLAYSQGFNPHPKITIAMPLAVGCTGENEPLDIILAEPIPEQAVVRALAPVMPPGFTVVSAVKVPPKSPALATLFVRAVYEILLAEVGEDDVKRRIHDLLEQETVLVEFRRKQFNVRPLIDSLTLSESSLADRGHPADKLHPADKVQPALMLRAVLLRDERGRIGRPDVLIEALGLTEHTRQIHRAQVVYQI